ncbi:MAG: DUF6484 domain-containing protein [Gemmatimonadaceae bacterium]|nr:DUF6484 domain-containing protein [Gemmatimonadaceae bacterium]
MMNELIQLPSVVIGEITDVDDYGAPRVRWQNAEPTSAQVVWMPSAPMWKHCIGARVVLGFVDGDERRPIVLGLLDAPKGAPQKPDVLHIESGRELVIECGEAKISLRKDGRIEIRGTHLISRSSGPNKIKGGSVFIN